MIKAIKEDWFSYLKFGSLVLFLLSWCLPALDGGIGAYIMLKGLMYIFFVFPLPVLANPLFIMAWRRLHHGKSPKILASLTLLLMILSLPIAMPDGLRMFYMGYVFWLIAGIWLFVLTFFSHKYAMPRLFFYTVLGSIALVVALFLIGNVQYHKASYKYREHFERGAIFSTDINPFGKTADETTVANQRYDAVRPTPKVTATSLVIPAKQTVEVHYQGAFYRANNDNNRRYSIAPVLPPRYVRAGFDWQHTTSYNLGKATKKPVDYHYRIEETAKDNFNLTITDKQANILYQQPVVFRRGEKLFSGEFEPKAYADNVATIFSELANNPQNYQMTYSENGGNAVHSNLDKQEEIFTNHCQEKRIEPYGFYVIDDMAIEPIGYSDLPPRFLCSPNYVIVLNYYWDDDDTIYRTNFNLIDKETLAYESLVTTFFDTEHNSPKLWNDIILGKVAISKIILNSKENDGMDAYYLENGKKLE